MEQKKNWLNIIKMGNYIISANNALLYIEKFISIVFGSFKLFFTIMGIP